MFAVIELAFVQVRGGTIGPGTARGVAGTLVASQRKGST